MLPVYPAIELVHSTRYRRWLETQAAAFDGHCNWLTNTDAGGNKIYKGLIHIFIPITYTNIIYTI